MTEASMDEHHEHHGLSEQSLARRRLMDKLVVGSVSVLGCVIVVAVVIFVVVDKLNQKPPPGEFTQYFPANSGCESSLDTCKKTWSPQQQIPHAYSQLQHRIQFLSSGAT